ncbi:uncharacterized protein RHO25_003935 [Cercospora beticola]|uniref:Uncharacterized protein n=1 Tax=Cercospora beticola TaxID=122368 RepID=A0ABZ0NID9_CERBT|nr:hypothetical protein RHO25_003935 [Cercospora beticola]CAK1360642.1 unnamed protein product [Cercospora beticola]
MSIWRGLDRASFEDDIAQLRKCTHQQPLPNVHSTYGATSTADEETKYLLPLGVETRLAEDFAFLAAVSSQPGSVAAATIAPTKDGTGLAVSLSANEGISERVRRRFEVSFARLRQCASCTISRHSCAEACCREMVALNRTRIQDRLKFRKHGTTFLVATRLQELSGQIEALQGVPSTEKRGLLFQVEALVTSISEVQDSRVKIQYHDPTEEEIDRLVNAAKAAFELVYGSSFDVSFAETSFNGCLESKLLRLGVPKRFSERREVRAVQKLAAYWRICLYLSVCARSYHKAFQDLTLHILPAPKPEIWPLKHGKKHYVHAEIQLLAYHETTTDITKPRAIAASKRPCYLCSTFILSHGTYSIPISHGEVYEQWTIPDSPAFTDETRLIMKRALRATAKVVQAALVAPKPSRPVMLPPKPQSLLDLRIHALRKASIFSLCTEAARRIMSRPADERCSSTLESLEHKLSPYSQQGIETIDVGSTNLQQITHSCSPTSLNSNETSPKASRADNASPAQPIDQHDAERRDSAISSRKNDRNEGNEVPPPHAADLSDTSQGCVVGNVATLDQYSLEQSKAVYRLGSGRNRIEERHDSITKTKPSSAWLALGRLSDSHTGESSDYHDSTMAKPSLLLPEKQAPLDGDKSPARVHTCLVRADSTNIVRHHWLELHISMENLKNSNMLLQFSGSNDVAQATRQTIHDVDLSIGEELTISIDSSTRGADMLMKCAGMDNVAVNLQIVDTQLVGDRERGGARKDEYEIQGVVNAI